MYWEPTTPRRSINHILIRLRIEHFYTHIYNVAWSEILPFFALNILVYKVLERIIYYFKVGVEQFYVL